MLAKPPRGGKWDPRFYPGVFVGMLNSSSEAVVATEQGSAIKTRAANVRKIRWDADRILGMPAVPWSLDGSDIALDIQVGLERPAEMVFRRSGEVLMENTVAWTYLRRTDLDPWGLSAGCPGCWYLRIGQGRQQTHSEACRRRLEAPPRGDSSGSARLAAVDERINRALTDTVERHATTDRRKRRDPVSSVIPNRSRRRKLRWTQTGLDTAPFSLIRRIISIRYTTQHHQKH